MNSRLSFAGILSPGTLDTCARLTPRPGTKEIFHRKPVEDFSNRKIRAIYCAGVSAGVSSAPAGVSVVVAGASVAVGVVTSVAAGAVVGAGVVAGATVSVFCSHAARSAAPARIQMYFFIVGEAYCFNRQIAARQIFGPRRILLEPQMLGREPKRVAPISSRAPRLRPGK